MARMILSRDDLLIILDDSDLLSIRRALITCADQIIDAIDKIDARTDELEDVDEDDDTITEPSLGATNDINQDDAWRPDAVPFSSDLESDDDDGAQPP